MKFRMILGGLAVALAGSVAQGQYGYYGYEFNQDTATTPIQGIDYGVARIIRSAGTYNYLTSGALLNLSQVQRMEIENRRLWTDTYFTMRRVNREAREAERGPRSTAADFIRYAQIGKPKRLSNSELDLVTGQIFWPVLLRSPTLTPFRTEVEKVFAARASTGTINAEEYLKVNQVTGMMLAGLRQHILNLPPSDYMVARRFLESLAYEARLPAI